jgi:hypothetical protein
VYSRWAGPTLGPRARAGSTLDGLLKGGDAYLTGPHVMALYEATSPGDKPVRAIGTAAVEPAD